MEVGQIHLSFCGYHVTGFFKSSCVNVNPTVSSETDQQLVTILPDPSNKQNSHAQGKKTNKKQQQTKKTL